MFRPAVKAAGIQKQVGSHFFRHFFATVFKSNGEDVKTVQESLRHATFTIPMEICTQAIPQALRDAHARSWKQLGQY